MSIVVRIFLRISVEGACPSAQSKQLFLYCLIEIRPKKGITMTLFSKFVDSNEKSNLLIFVALGKQTYMVASSWVMLF